MQNPEKFNAEYVNLIKEFEKYQRETRNAEFQALLEDVIDRAAWLEADNAATDAVKRMALQSMKNTHYDLTRSVALYGINGKKIVRAMSTDLQALSNTLGVLASAPPAVPTLGDNDPDPQAADRYDAIREAIDQQQVEDDDLPNGYYVGTTTHEVKMQAVRDWYADVVADVVRMRQDQIDDWREQIEAADDTDELDDIYDEFGLGETAGMWPRPSTFGDDTKRAKEVLYDYLRGREWGNQELGYRELPKEDVEDMVLIPHSIGPLTKYNLRNFDPDMVEAAIDSGLDDVKDAVTAVEYRRIGPAEPIEGYRGGVFYQDVAPSEFYASPGNVNSINRPALGVIPAVYTTPDLTANLDEHKKKGAIDYATGYNSKLDFRSDTTHGLLYEVVSTPPDVINLGDCKDNVVVNAAYEAGFDAIACPDFWEQSEVAVFSPEHVQVENVYSVDKAPIPDGLFAAQEYKNNFNPDWNQPSRSGLRRLSIPSAKAPKRKAKGKGGKHPYMTRSERRKGG